MSPRQVPLPLYQKVLLKYTSHRVLDIIILVLLLSLLLYRLLSLNNHGFLWLLAFLCESWFTFSWFLLVNMKWNPVRYITYPENLEKRFSELPPVDMFVTTADPVLEHPIITVNTVLSLLAVDYPANKLACYVSDDGCSPVTFYSLLQASRFAQLWVPFCKKYKIQVRAPFRYFLVKSPISNDNAEFQQEWIKMKGEYEQLREKIENAAKMSAPLDETGELAVFSGVERGNHPTIVKIIWKNKEAISDGVPHLVYISREKRPKHHHRYKAGAMNVLTRVSGLMTNAPFLLNVDCDMFVNNPEVVRQAMCLLLGTNNERESAFIQFPQIFYDAPKDDPYGNQFVALYKYGCPGITGIQGFFYAGTGCFHRRKVIYGLWPAAEDNSIIGNLSSNGLVKEYGNSKEFVESAVQALKGEKEFPNNLSNNLEAACQVADCSYEYGTNWGNKHGWMYGSVVEDVLTGLTIHNKGWKTIFVAPESPAFLGCAPSGGPAALTQQKRWATGLLESLVGRNSPILGFLTAKLLFRQCLAYVWVLSWSLASIPEICYAVLPAYCIITNSHFLPKVHEQAVYIPVAIFVLYNLYTLLEYIKTGLSFRAWWNNQRMARITAMTAYLFGILGVLLKFLGLSETVFEVTPKDQPTDDDDVSETNTEFTFDEMPLFVPGTALLLVQITAMFTILSGLRQPGSNENGVGPLEVLCSIWVILCFWPFLKGLFRKGKYGIPLPTIFKSAALALVFVNLCWTTTSAYSGRCPGPVE